MGNAIASTKEVVISESITEFLIVNGTALLRTLKYVSNVGTVGNMVGGQAKASAILLKEFNSIRIMGEIMKRANTNVTKYGVNLCSIILISIFDLGVVELMSFSTSLEDDKLSL